MKINMLGSNAIYNVQLANLYGIECAVYLQSVIDNWIDYCETITKPYCVLNRDKIQKKTALLPSNQLSCQKILINEGIISEKDLDTHIILNYDKIEEKFSLSDAQISEIKNQQKLNTKDEQAKKKQHYIITGVKSTISHRTDEIDKLLGDWVEAVVVKYGYSTGEQVKIAQSILDDFCKNDFNRESEIIKIAIVNNYKDINWAIQKYKENHFDWQGETSEPVNRTFVTSRKDILF